MSSWSLIWSKDDEFTIEFRPQWPLRSLEAKVKTYFLRSFDVILKFDMVKRWWVYYWVLVSVASEVIRGQSKQIILRSLEVILIPKMTTRCRFRIEFWPLWPLRSLEAKVKTYNLRSFEVILKLSFSFFIFIFVFWGSFFQSCDFEMIVKTKQQVCTAINSLFVQLTLRADPPMSLVLSMIGNFSTSKAVCVEQKLIFFIPSLGCVYLCGK